MTQRRGATPLWESKNGRAPKGICRECGKRVPKGRRRWCSDACVTAFGMRGDPNVRRQVVFARDNGVCSACQRDCVKLAGTLRVIGNANPVLVQWIHSGLKNLAELNESILAQLSARQPAGWDVRVQQALTLAIELDLVKHLGHRTTWWDLDHHCPLSEGGTHELKNLRTLCLPCHKKASAVGATRRARSKREAK